MTDEEAATRVCKVLQGRSPDPIPIGVLKNLSKKATLSDNDFARGVQFAKGKGWIVQKAKIVSLVPPVNGIAGWSA